MPGYYQTALDPAKIAWQNECDGWLALGENQASSPIFRLQVVGGVTCAWWLGAASEMENYAMLPPGFSDDLETALQTPQLSTLHNNSVTVLRYLQTDEQPGWRQVLSRQGYILADTAPLLAVQLQGWSQCSPKNSRVRVDRVDASCEYQDACALVQRVFGGPLSVTRFFSQPEITSMYAARLGERLVGAATMWPFANAAGVFSVSTEPELRRQGIATAVLDNLLNNARQEGFTIATLRTTDNFIPFYARCGFKPVGRVVRWIRLRTDMPTNINGD